MGDENESLQELHSHCKTCHNVVCNILPDYCPIINCPNLCKIKFHACKLKEHILVCRMHIRPCVNEKYGCPFKFNSLSIVEHLEKCPASVVLCKSTYPDHSPLLGEILKQMQKEKTEDDLCDISKLAIGSESDFYHECWRHIVEVPLNFLGEKRSDSSLGGKCLQVLRRDQYKWHVKNTHDDIPDKFGHFYEVCPMAQYGCPFKQFRAKPKYLDGRIQQSKICSVINAINPSDKSLVDLGVDVLLYLLGFLDNLTLCCLSKTCHAMRNLCFEVLDMQGVVYYKWTRNNNTAEDNYVWQLDGKSKRFTVSHTPITDWVMTDEPALGNHVEKCEFNERLDMPSGWVKVMPDCD